MKSDEIIENALNEYVDSGKLAAIAYIRNKVGFGLKEAKLLIEKIISDAGGE